MLFEEPIPYPTSTDVKPLPNTPQPWPGVHAPRPSLNAGLAGSPVTGEPSSALGIIAILKPHTGLPGLLQRGPEDITILLSGDLRHGPKKNAAAEQSMRRTIQDLVSSIDPNVKIAPEVEDVRCKPNWPNFPSLTCISASIRSGRRIYRFGCQLLVSHC
jgi:transcription initiation factor TFIID subunit 12